MKKSSKVFWVFKGGCFTLSFSPYKVPLLAHNGKFLDYSC